MDQQTASDNKLKKSRSAARHLRRKKLVAARREAEKNSSTDSNSGIEKTNHSEQKSVKSSVGLTQLDIRIVPKPNSKNVESGNNEIDANSKHLLDLLYHKNPLSQDDQVHTLSKSRRENLIESHNLKTKCQDSCTESSCNTVKTDRLSIKKINFSDKNLEEVKMNPEDKSKDQVKAEREAKKAAKAAAKAKAKVKDKSEEVSAVQTKYEKHEDKRKSNVQTVTKAMENISIESPAQTEAINNSKRQIDVTSKKNEEGGKVVEKEGEKSKAELKAERRAKQEAQRAAKQAGPTNKKKEDSKSTTEKTHEKKESPKVNKESKELVKKPIVKIDVKENIHEVNLFKHLYLNRKKIAQVINQNNTNLHPAIVRLGVQYAEKIIVGSNARCVALLAAIKQLIMDFERPSQADFTRGLETSLQESINYLNFCRPAAVSMQNALKHLKWQMSILPSAMSDEEAKLKLANAIDTYIQEQILLADKAISNAIQKKISNGDVILTYGYSSLIHKILCDAHSAGRKFRVVIIDGRPLLEGRELLRRLVKHGIDCSYMLINALSFVMPQVSKVFLGAHAILANGAVMSRVGTAQVALMANAFNVPVLVACETHKSCERVQTDSIVYNEIGDPDLLVKDVFTSSKKKSLSNWRSKKTLNLLNITYDVTPADLVTAVVTELAILPCTSVPVILRIKPSEI